jgi:hypothetical protein
MPLRPKQLLTVTHSRRRGCLLVVLHKGNSALRQLATSPG